MDELKRLLENAGINEEWSLGARDHRDQPYRPAINPKTKKPYTQDEWNAGKEPANPVKEDDSDLDWGDEMIEDLKLLLDNTVGGKIDAYDLEHVISQYERPPEPGMSADGKKIDAFFNPKSTNYLNTTGDKGQNFDQEA